MGLGWRWWPWPPAWGPLRYVLFACWIVTKRSIARPIPLLPTAHPVSSYTRTRTHTQAFVPSAPLKQQLGQQGGALGARTRGEARMAAGETALIIQNKGGSG